MKLITIILLLISSYSFGQNNDSVRVRVKVKKTTPYCLLESKKANYYIECPCDSLRRGQIVYVRERDLLTNKN
jgi:hypothetical protein